MVNALQKLLINCMKTALVTGASQNIGKAAAISLAQAGYTVALHYHTSQTTINTVLQEVKAYSSDSFLVQADLTMVDEVEQMKVDIQSNWNTP